MKGSTTEGPCLSSETPITDKPLSAYFFWSATNPGISARQGGHHVAQKSKMITLPLKSESFTGFPSTSLNCKSGAAILESVARHVAPPKRKAWPPISRKITFKYQGAYLTIVVSTGPF